MRRKGQKSCTAPAPAVAHTDTLPSALVPTVGAVVTDAGPTRTPRDAPSLAQARCTSWFPLSGACPVGAHRPPLPHTGTPSPALSPPRLPCTPIRPCLRPHTLLGVPVSGAGEHGASAEHLCPALSAEALSRTRALILTIPVVSGRVLCEPHSWDSRSLASPSHSAACPSSVTSPGGSEWETQANREETIVRTNRQREERSASTLLVRPESQVFGEE